MTEPGARLALVTGGLHRLGAVIAARLADAGFALALHTRHAGEPDPALAEALARNGTEHAVLAADLAVDDEVERLVPATIERFGRAPDLLVNSASLFTDSDWRSAGFADHIRHFAINTAAPILLAQRVAAHARAERPALIVNILDQRIAQPPPDQFSYAISKLSLAGATRLLATALAPHARVNGIAPGFTLPGPEYGADQLAALPGLMPLGRLPEPADIADAVLYLWQARAVTGQILFVDGGASLRSFERDFVYLERTDD